MVYTLTTTVLKMGNSYRDRTDHVEARKRIQTYSSHTLVLYYISSERESAARVSVTDQIPLTVSQENIQFYHEFRSHEFELYKVDIHLRLKAEESRALGYYGLQTPCSLVLNDPLSRSNRKTPGCANQPLLISPVGGL